MWSKAIEQKLYKKLFVALLLTLKLLAGGADASDDVGYVTKDSGEEQKAEEQLYDDEQILELAARPGQVPDGGERQRAPVVALQILLHDIRGLAVAVHPVLTAERVVLVDDVIQTTVPMEDHQ